MDISTNDNAGESVSQTDDVSDPRYQRVEVIKVRRKREIDSLENSLSTIRSKLFRTFKTKGTIISKPDSISYVESGGSSENPQQFVRSMEIISHKFKSKPSNARSKNLTPEEKSILTNNHNIDEVIWNGETSQWEKQTDNRAHERIPAWQWNFMTRSLKRDKEHQER